jgi:ABC-type multidrug transport system ATPase subunit
MDATPWVQVVNLTKQFKKKLLLAVTDINFTFYRSALLGHNGAGSSSFHGMLTGLLTLTKGNCYIGGKSIWYDTFRASQTIGFCPQENILYD